MRDKLSQACFFGAPKIRITCALKMVDSSIFAPKLEILYVFATKVAECVRPKDKTCAPKMHIRPQICARVQNFALRNSPGYLLHFLNSSAYSWVATEKVIGGIFSSGNYVSTTVCEYS